ncbi:phosphatase PAP2 family protein [Niabella beijingensis]|uniref:phosphatase PAP2 family protein n=1 Tax=Niabella beijingensis TaxID=2872700 RepID=UPI001CBF1563|nr:phosphatase PAP2 family protein [Niabella beijingensis]MBZ4192431.1 phosphatase PAP2 family protein [Niabella beijingensis]
MDNQKRSAIFNNWIYSFALRSNNIINNYSRLKTVLFILPIFLLITIILQLYSQNALSVDGYIQIQKGLFFSINYNLGQYPNLQFNLTQFGDALIFLSFLSIFIIYVPKIWEALIPGLLVSALFSCPLKKIFAVPRPAAMFTNNSFIIIGEKLSGSNSLPSGHSVTIFTILTVLLFAFTPQKLKYKTLFFLCVIIMGLVLGFTRVGVGAHYPLDVIVGSIIGYISGLIGIFISRKYKFFTWVNNKKCYPVFILLFLIGCIMLMNKIINENLIIFYLAFVSLIVSLYKITNIYAKKQSEVKAVL